MGIRLVDEVLDHAPADLTPTQRLLLVAIAHAARDSTRKGWPGRERLVQRTGLTQRSLRRVLDELAARGLELREATGVGRDGRPVYASRGHATVYRVPDLAPVKGGRPQPPSEEVKGDAGRSLSGEKGGHARSERGPLVVRKGAVDDPPSLQEPSGTRDARAHARLVPVVMEALRERTGRTIDHDHATRVVRQLLGDRDGIRDPARYLAGAIAKDPEPTRFLPTPTPPRFRSEGTPAR
jgi:hypothetical protein